MLIFSDFSLALSLISPLSLKKFLMCGWPACKEDDDDEQAIEKDDKVLILILLFSSCKQTHNVSIILNPKFVR